MPDAAASTRSIGPYDDDDDDDEDTEMAELTDDEDIPWSRHSRPPAALASLDWSPPTIKLDVRTLRDYHSAKAVWEASFEQHHYLDCRLHTAAQAEVCREATTGALVGFIATCPSQGTTIEPGKTRLESRLVRREHRVVVLPAWQGVGIGPKLSNLIASTWVATKNETQGDLHRYTCKTAHPRFGAYREAGRSGTVLWEAAASNRPPKFGAEAKKDQAYVHFYVGPPFPFPPGGGRMKPIVRNPESQATKDKRKAERDERIAEEKTKRQRVLEWPAEKTKRTPKKKAVA